MKTIAKIKSTLNKESILSVLAISGVIGFLLGVIFSTWQVSVETGQVLSGIVKYPVDNPVYMYHAKIFTAINHLSALLLYMIGSERIVSVIISGFLGMISFQALSVFIFSINRDIFLSLGGMLLIYGVNYIGEGVRYPIRILGFEHTYGLLGLSFVLLVIGLIGARAYKLGFFCLGLAPYIHPSWGSWLLMITLFSSLVDYKSVKIIFKAYYKYFFIGVFIVVLGFVYQSYHMRILPVLDPETEVRYLSAFIKHWDAHRTGFFSYDPIPYGFRYIAPGLGFSLYSIILSFLSVTYFKYRKSVSLMFRIMMVSGILSLLLAVFTHVPPKFLPKYFLMFMPGRYINLNIISLAASFYGIVTWCIRKQYGVSYVFATVVLLTLAFILPMREIKVFTLILVWFTYVTLRKNIQETIVFSRIQRFIAKKRNVVRYTVGAFLQQRGVVLSRIFFVVCSGIFSFYLAFLLFLQFFLGIHFRDNRFYDRTNVSFFSVISSRPGLAVISSDFHLFSLKTRRALLYDPSSADGFSMVPESGDAVENILNKVYGVSIFKPHPDCRNAGGICSRIHKELWEGRSVRDWQAIKEEFGVADIITHRTWKLSLPAAYSNHRGIVYEIPEGN